MLRLVCVCNSAEALNSSGTVPPAQWGPASESKGSLRRRARGAAIITDARRGKAGSGGAAQAYLSRRTEIWRPSISVSLNFSMAALAASVVPKRTVPKPRERTLA